jgi:serine/threonine-protein kinase
MSAFQPGDLIGGRYRLQRIIGAGAMGTVWSARNESTDRDFALKLMLPDAVKNPIALQRFFQEAKASGRLRHRSIVEVYDLGKIEQVHGERPDPRAGTPYLVMELLEGEPLDVVLRRKKQLPAGTALRVVRDLARGLDVAHKQRIIHRDLKPANIYLHKTLEGTIVPKILDFGVSKLIGPTNFDPIATSVGTVLGSPAYMSPEQAAGEVDVDGRSDVWSLGVILYKCLSGSVPFSAPNYNALMVAIGRSTQESLATKLEGAPASAIAAVDTLIGRCLAKDRSGRFQSASELAQEIEKVLAEHPDLPQVALEEIVDAPVEGESEDLHTAATLAIENYHGTLMGTELAGNVGSGSARPTPARPAVQRAEPKVAVPEFRPGLSKRARIVASGVGAVCLLAVVAFASRRPNEPAGPAAAPAAFEVPRLPSAAPRPPPSAAPSAATTTTTETPPLVETTDAATAEPVPTTNVVASPPPKAWRPPVPAKPPKPPATTPTPTGPRPVHEGVTGAGF